MPRFTLSSSSSLLWLGFFLLALLLSGCQSLPNFGSNNKAQQAANWHRLEAGQTLASFQHYAGPHSLAKPLNTNWHGDWRSLKPSALPEYDLWDRLRANFAMDISSDDPRVQAELNWYSRHQAYLNRVSLRASRYMFHIVEELEAQGLPGELALLPIVESAYDPFAYSHGRAAGMWQFIPGTAKHFGLANNWWYDGRRDILASTQAALTYLRQLNNRFDDWHLALASYNAGGGNVNRALRHNRAAGGSGSFWELRLPVETSAYVPKMVALARLVADPEKYGVSLPSIPNEPYFAAVETQGQLDLALAADLAEISLDELYFLNPGFSQWATDPEGPHLLLVPYAQAEVFNANLASLPPSQRMRWLRYSVKSGDSLLSLGQKFNTTPNRIKSANSLRTNVIRVGQQLLIPVPSKKPSSYAQSANQRLERKQNVNRQGVRVEHLVKSGDSFWELARRHQVGVRELANWNNLAPTDPLKPGMRLVIWSQAAGANPQAMNEPQAQNLGNPNLQQRSIIRKVNYKVRNGDNLASIASRFRVSVNDITRWNSLNPKRYLQPGQNLTLHVDVTRN